MESWGDLVRIRLRDPGHRCERRRLPCNTRRSESIQRRIPISVLSLNSVVHYAQQGRGDMSHLPPVDRAAVTFRISHSARGTVSRGQAHCEEFAQAALPAANLREISCFRALAVRRLAQTRKQDNPLDRVKG